MESRASSREQLSRIDEQRMRQCIKNLCDSHQIPEMASIMELGRERRRSVSLGKVDAIPALKEDNSNTQG